MIKIGDYVRTKSGIIGKVIDYMEAWDDDFCVELDSDNTRWYYSDAIAAWSSNVLKLLKTGDYVNGYYVFVTNDGVVNYFNIDRGQRWAIAHNIRIKDIVTKEQFEKISYKVNRKDKEITLFIDGKETDINSLCLNEGEYIYKRNNKWYIHKNQ